MDQPGLLSRALGMLSVGRPRSILYDGPEYDPNALPPTKSAAEVARRVRDEYLNPETRGVGVNTVLGFTEGPAAIKAFHGSPHSFSRFDMSKLGTGEGAQAYGHGLYFAGSEDVAKGYRDALAVTDSRAQHANRMVQAGIPMDAVAARLAQSYPSLKPDDIERLLRDASGPPPGHMYEVNLNTDPSRLLDWDKPMSAQSDLVQAKARNLSNRGLAPRDIDPQMTGGMLYQELGHKLPGSKNVAATLAEPLPGGGDAVQGIQYLDGGSRAAGEGSRNYVMFDDKLIDIMRKYGMAPLLMGGAGAGMLDQAPAQ